MRRFIISSTIPLVLVALAVYSIMSWWGPDYQWRQKLTVTVETPEGLKSGSAVTEVSVHHNRIFKDGAEWRKKVRGEAVAVDLGGSKYVFAVLNNPDGHGYVDMSRLAQDVIFDEQMPNSGDEVYSKISSSRGSYEIPRSRYPTLVAFVRIDDPSTVMIVAPEEFAATFGDGYRLRSVALELNDFTENAPTSALLPWLREQADIPLCKPRSSFDFSLCAAKLHHGDFLAR